MLIFSVPLKGYDVWHRAIAHLDTPNIETRATARILPDVSGKSDRIGRQLLRRDAQRTNCRISQETRQLKNLVMLTAKVIFSERELLTV
ncbi:MAG TPA: hypothetical protein DDW76_37755 [Cyanobacteria bacterium UBA11369]|nr:hypothetical protein [Cyanobacteria bacterium UBA11371]HBE33485.1 hypothetical protein [Cyanobacteria bacterium UBA11368]HBE54344.1 hypothetical protein [Cyanobacteria bacterium UBA11369]